jgi:4-hydroxy-tetrahydrodipicolinate synthase
MNRITEVIERTREENVSILSGDDAMTLPVIATGGTGCISVSANIEPERTCAMVGAALSEDMDRARDIHHELGPLFRKLFMVTNPIPIKEAMELRGHYDSGRMRSPLSRMDEDDLAELEAVLADLEDEPMPEATEAAE